MADAGDEGPLGGLERHTCITCQCSYTSRSNLERHVREKHAGQRHVCERCGATFARRYRLEAHVRTHAGAEPFQCSLCPVTAATRAGLARHVRCHATAAGSHACPDCGQSFSHYWRMKLHRRHHGRAQHACRHCGRIFRHASTLAQHATEHAPEPEPEPDPEPGAELQIELGAEELEGGIGAELAEQLGQLGAGLRVELEERDRVGETLMVITLLDE